MKKIIIPIFIFIIIIGLFSVAYAEPLQQVNQLEEMNQSSLVAMKSDQQSELERYKQLYGSETYGFTAYILSKLQIFSIPLCFLGIAVGSIYQYVIGIRRLDIRDKGFALIIVFVTILVICQILPLVFAVVVQGWRG